MAEGGRLVAEGRDCGTVVFPSAPYKFYLTASIEERARRRRADLARLGLHPSLASIRRDLGGRDRTDAGRGYGALAVPVDSWVVDNTGLGPAETVAVLVRRVDTRGLISSRRSGRMLPEVIRRALRAPGKP